MGEEGKIGPGDILRFATGENRTRRQSVPTKSKKEMKLQIEGKWKSLIHVAQKKDLRCAGLL